MALTKTEVSKLYVSIFNRASEGAGNTYWQEDAADLKDAAAKMLATPDAATYFGTSLDSNQAFIEHIYLNTLNKTASQDAEGIAYWVNQLNSGLSRAEIVGSLVTAVDDYAASTDPVTAFAYHQVTNRVAVSDSIADSGITDMAFTQKALAAVSADMSTLDIVENLVAMVQDNPTALTEVSNTLVEVKELIAANASDATASAAVLANLATVIENVAASSTSGTISNLSSTLSALTATVEAAKTDAAFIANPQTLASSIATNPTVVTQSANTTVTTGTAVEVPTTPTTPSGGGSSGGGGSSTPATPTFTVTNTEGVVTFGGTATGNISMSITNDVATFTRGGITATTTAILSGDGAITKITIADGQTLADTAADLTGLTIDGEGTVNVTALEDTLDADLSGITATTVTAGFDATTETPEAAFNFAGKLGNAQVNITGNGALSIYTATVDENVSFNVASTASLIGTDEQLSTKTITGAAGTVIVTALANDTDTSTFADTLTVTAQVTSGSVDVSSNENLVNINYFHVDTGTTLTLTAAQLDASGNGLVGGAGSVNVTASDSDDTFSVTTSGTNSITAGLGLDTITLGVETGIDTIVVGAGTTTYEATDSLDMTGVATDDTIEVTLDNTGYTFTYDGSAWADTDNAAGAGFTVTVDSSTPATTGVTVAAASTFTLNSVAGAVADDGTTNPATPAGSASDDASAATTYEATDSLDMTGVATDDTIEVTLDNTGYTFTYNGSAWADTDNAAGAGFTVTVDSSTPATTGVTVAAASTFTLNSVAGAVADDGTTNPATPAGSASDDASAASTTASDSPFATPDTITNFTHDTDKLHLPSDSVATGTGGIIGDNSANTEDVAIGSTGTSIDFGTVTNGVIVFSDDAETPAEITIDSTDAMTAALTYLSANISDGDTVAFDYNIDSVSGTIVFQGDAGGDIAVNLIGVSASSLGADLDLVALP